MEYVELKCRNCGSPIRVGKDVTHIRCDHCGSEFVLRNRQTNIQNINYGNGVLYQSYIPDGWNVNVFDDNETLSSLAPVNKGLQLCAPNGPQLVFYPFAFFKDNDMKSILHRTPLEYQTDFLTLVCYSRFMSINDYAQRRIISICQKIIQGQMQQIDIKPLSCNHMMNMALQFQQDSTDKMGKESLAAPLKFSFTCIINNQTYKGYFASILSHIDNTKNSNDFIKKGLSFMGAMYGIGGLGSFDWGRCFDLILIYQQEDTIDYENTFDKFLSNIRYGPTYFALQEQELRNTQQVQVQGAMSRQQNAIRASQNISRTLSETSNIVNDATWSHSQQMNNIIDHSSDGIRGVENYHDSYGNAYQADVKYDYIYKKGDTYVGSTNGSLQLGPDWEELKK